MYIEVGTEAPNCFLLNSEVRVVCLHGNRTPLILLHQMSLEARQPSAVKKVFVISHSKTHLSRQDNYPGGLDSCFALQMIVLADNSTHQPCVVMNILSMLASVFSLYNDAHIYHLAS